MNYLPEKLILNIIRYRFWFISGILLLTIFWSWCFLNIKQNNGFDIWFDKNDNSYQEYSNFKKHFGDDRKLVIIYNNDSLFSNYQLAENRILTKKLEEIDGVDKVLSLTNLRIPKLTPFQILPIKVIPKNVTNQTKLKEKLCSLNILVDNIISKDGKATTFQISTKGNFHNKSVYEEVKTLMSVIPDNENYYLTGDICIYEETTLLSSTEPLTYFSTALIIMIAILFIVFRNYISPFIPIISSVISIIWTIGLLSLMGGSINMLTGIIPLVLLVITVAFSIHIISSFNNELQTNPDTDKAIIESFRKVLVPGSIAALTTSFAFLAFTFSSISPIRQFGIFTSAGVIISYTLTLILLPIILYTYKKIIGRKFTPVILIKETYFERLGLFINSSRKNIVVVALLVFLISLNGILKLTFETDQLKYFKRSNAVRVASDTAKSWFNGIYPIEYSFSLTDVSDDSLYSFFTNLKALQNKIVQIDEVEICHSIVGVTEAILASNNFKYSEDYIFHRLMNAKTSNSRKSYLNHFISQENKSVRMTVKSRWLNIQEVIGLTQKIDTKIKSQLKADVIPHSVTGSGTLLAKLNDELIHAQIISLSFSFLIILIMFFLVFRKPIYFISGILPNILPVTISLGIMGYASIPIDAGTVLIASISLGIAVDDTVYLMYSIKHFRKKYQVLESVQLSFIRVWRALTITTLILSVGFSVLIYSSYTPVIYLGLFVSLNILFALIYDFLLLPALLLSNHQKS